MPMMPNEQVDFGTTAKKPEAINWLSGRKRKIERRSETASSLSTCTCTWKRNLPVKDCGSRLKGLKGARLTRATVRQDDGFRPRSHHAFASNKKLGSSKGS